MGWDIVSTQTRALLDSALRQTATLSQMTSFVPADQSLVMAPFVLTPPERVECVLIGDGPSAVAGASDGLAWSDTRPLREADVLTRRVLAEWVADGGARMPDTGSLASWARHGVLMVNRTPVACPAKPELPSMVWSGVMGSILTDFLSVVTWPVVVLAWGAQNLRFVNGVTGALDDEHKDRVIVISSDMPERLPSRRHYGHLRPFSGSHPFTSANHALEGHSMPPIDWSL